MSAAPDKRADQFAGSRGNAVIVWRDGKVQAGWYWVCSSDAAEFAGPHPTSRHALLDAIRHGRV